MSKVRATLLAVLASGFVAAGFSAPAEAQYTFYSSGGYYDPHVYRSNYGYGNGYRNGYGYNPYRYDRSWNNYSSFYGDRYYNYPSRDQRAVRRLTNSILNLIF